LLFDKPTASFSKMTGRGPDETVRGAGRLQQQADRLLPHQVHPGSVYTVPLYHRGRG
jgi:hypothetical protein